MEKQRNISELELLDLTVVHQQVSFMIITCIAVVAENGCWANSFFEIHPTVYNTYNNLKEDLSKADAEEKAKKAAKIP